MKKRLSLLMVLMMIVSLLPMSAFAASTAYPGGVQNVDVDGTGSKTVTFELDSHTSLEKGDIRFDLKNAELTSEPVVKVNGTAYKVNQSTDDLFFVKVPSAVAHGGSKIKVEVIFNYKATNEGDLVLSVTDYDTNIGSQDVVFAKAKEVSHEDLAIVVEKPEKAVSFDGGALSQFEIKNFKNLTGTQIKVELDDEDIKFAGTKVIVDGGAPFTVSGNSFTVSVTNATKSVVVIPDVNVGRKVSEGNVNITVSSTAPRMSSRATIGQVTDFSITMTVVENGKKEIPNVWGGESATVKVTIEGPRGSILDNRDIDFELDGATVDGTGTFVGSLKDINDDRNEFSVANNAIDTEKITFTFTINTKANKDGVATITAAQRGWEVTADLAKVTPKFTIETKVTPVKKGESKTTADIVIKEAKAGLLDRTENITLQLNSRRDYVQFVTSDVTVEGTNGMKFDDTDWFVTTGVEKYTAIEIPVKKLSSGEAAEITISGVKVLVDGSTTEDVLNIIGKLGNKEVAKAEYVKVVKEYDLESIVSVFTIGQAAYTVNGEEKTAAAAPYIKEGRTMLPIRAVAESLGLTVQWNQATKTASFTDANKVAAVTIGASVIYVNGTPMPLTVPAELTNDTTFVELRSLATAFGVQIDWDAAAKMATVSK